MTNRQMLSKTVREELCYEEDCQEHAGGVSPCPIPLYKDEAQKKLASSGNSGDMLKEHATPKTATGIVERSDDE